MKEEWRPVVGYEGRYMVSNFGRVKSLICSHGIRKKDKFLYQMVYRKNSAGAGYKLVSLHSPELKRKYKPVHQIVAEAWIPNPDNKPIINHIDGNPENNHIDNLEWCTYSENTLHAYRMLGHENPNNKAVICIETGTEYKSASEACKAVGVAHGVISNAIRRYGQGAYSGGYHWRNKE